MRTFLKYLRWFFFILFLFLAIGQLPTYVGRYFLCMAVLACPIRKVVWFVNEMLKECSLRWFWFLYLVVALSRLSDDEFGAAGRRMGMFLRWLLEMFGIL